MENITPLLIEIDAFTEDKIIPQATDRVRIETAIRDAQQFDLRPMLGDRLYTDLILTYDTNDSDVANPYTALMLGVDYADSDGYDIHFPGLRMALKYWSFARFLDANQVNVTTHSVVQKTWGDSTPTDRKTITAQIEAARSGAVSYWAQARKYIKDHEADFPLYKGEKSEPRGGFKIRVGGKNY